jgi:glyoxylase-like metal-dependent hydrolase (beta-lactamase superfamily II)
MRQGKRVPAVAWCGAVALAAGLAGPAAADAADYQHFVWHEPAPGIWLGVTPASSFISGNTIIIALPDGGSMVVDPHISEFTANEIVAKVKQVSAAPVRYLVDTHLHNDHTQGNTAFKKAFPQVEIIAHENTCAGIKEKAMGRSRWRLGKLGRELDEIKANRKDVTDPKVAEGLDRIIAGNELYLKDAATLVWTMPTQCLALKAGEKKVYGSGARTIEIGYYGRAHTAGDLVAYLPKEKILINGDLWSERGGMGGDGRDGSILEAPRTLKAIRALDFDLVLPGHGDLFRGKQGLDVSIAAAEALIARVKESHANGDYIERTLELVTAPPRAGVPVQGEISKYVPYMRSPAEAGWKRSVTRAYEELELRQQLGLPID